jgi:hypothetical protein
MENLKHLFIIFLTLIILFIYFYSKYTLTGKEKFQLECESYGDDYNACYSNSNCTIGFLPDGSTHCMKKFLQEDI